MTDDRAELAGPSAVLRTYLASARTALLWKLEGLGERELRLPRTPTGTSLLGIVLHCANVEIGYFGPTFGRRWPDPEHPAHLAPDVYDTDPQADWTVPVDLPAAELVAFYERVGAFADAALAELPLDAVGEVPWWPEGRRRATLHEIAVHVMSDLYRHAGHADVLREQVDGAVGMRPGLSNVPDGVEWPAYVARLTAIAERFPAQSG
ncbi:DinB family protein [Nocardioides albidus]|uniref:DinB family protein n=1 Tax=Nocardioides albidus TaxID=1517589 RepID=A0A5C4W5C3_9ACTN|nr:DinB family protein [Nocardioides albidus]TNM43351.1 DinB family protein [Nocardioides albidus]